MKNNMINLKKTSWAIVVMLSALVYVMVNSCGNTITQKSEVEMGKDLYLTYCQLCHGENGDGAMAEMLKVPPPDLTLISKRRNGVFSDEEIYKIIDGGEALASGHGDRPMPIWGEVFAQGENIDQVMVPKKIYQLIEYLKSIQK